MNKDKDEWGNIELPNFGDDKLFDPNLNRKLAAQLTTSDPEWKKNNLEAITKPDVVKRKSEATKKQWANGRTEAVQSISKTIEEKWKDPSYVLTQKIGRRERYANPERCGNYKGPVIGICKKTGNKIICIGVQQIKDAGFEPANVYACIAGTRKSTGGYIWSRK